MLYFIQKDGTVKVLSFLRAIWFGDFEALRHPAPPRRGCRCDKS